MHSEKFRSHYETHYEELKTRPLHPMVAPTAQFSSQFYIREPRRAGVHRWDWLARYLGLKSDIIVSKIEDHTSISIFARWPLELPFRLGHTVTGQMLWQSAFPSILKLGLSPQNTIPRDSEIITACQKGDMLKIREILTTKQVHPNDRTPDNLTVFRVGRLAVLSFAP